MTNTKKLSEFFDTFQMLSPSDMLFICGGGFHKHHFTSVQPQQSPTPAARLATSPVIEPIEVTDVIVDYGVYIGNWW